MGRSYPHHIHQYSFLAKPTFQNFQLRDLMAVRLFLPKIGWFHKFHTMYPNAFCHEFSDFFQVPSPFYPFSFDHFFVRFSDRHIRHVISTWGRSTSTRRHRRTCPGGPAVSTAVSFPTAGWKNWNPTCRRNNKSSSLAVTIVMMTFDDI